MYELKITSNGRGRLSYSYFVFECSASLQAEQSISFLVHYIDLLDFVTV